MIEGVGIHLLDRRGRAGDADVVDQHVETAEPLDDFGEEPLDIRRVGNIGHDVGIGCRICVDHHDPRSPSGEGGGDRRADADPPPVTSAAQPLKILGHASILTQVRPRQERE